MKATVQNWSNLKDFINIEQWGLSSSLVAVDILHTNESLVKNRRLGMGHVICKPLSWFVKSKLKKFKMFYTCPLSFIHLKETRTSEQIWDNKCYLKYYYVCLTLFDIVKSSYPYDILWIDDPANCSSLVYIQLTINHVKHAGVLDTSFWGRYKKVSNIT